MKKIFILLITLILVGISAIAQNNHPILNDIYGKVTSEDGLPIPFIDVYIKGNPELTFVPADFDGIYSIKAKTNDTLVFSYIGYKTKEIVVENNVINVKLEVDSSMQESIVPPMPGTSFIPNDLAGAIITKEMINNIFNPKYNFKRNAENNLFLIFVSELKSYDLSVEDLKFQETFNVRYAIIGGYKNDYVLEYNKLTFKYLNKKNKNKSWQSEIRRDAVGLEYYIK